ncbi:MAG: hypothetical protein ACI96N_003247 [Arenicella sp.]|jgi:hypothetical protein
MADSIEKKEELPDEEKLWKRYQMHVDLYKYYLDYALKINIFYYGITGAILSYYFTNDANGTSRELVLLLPIAISVCLYALFSFAQKTYIVSVEDIEIIAKKLGMNRWVRTDAFILISRGSSYLMGSVALCLLTLFLSRAL